jgi:hypothetical protein
MGLCAIFFCSCAAYVYDVKAARKWYPEYKRYHFWIGCCDFHDKTHKANTFQRKKIENLLSCCDPTTIEVHVEDLSSANDAGRTGYGSYYINSRQGILAGLGNFCKMQGIPYCNVEYRYCRVVALGPIINNITADPGLFPSTCKITVAHLMNEIEQTYNDLLLNFNHAPGFKAALTRKKAHVTQLMTQLNWIRDQQKTIADYVAATSTPLNRLNAVKYLLTFDGILLGFKLADAAMKHPEKQKKIAFAGGTHINEAYELLLNLGGYEPVNQITATHLNAPALMHSVGANITDPSGGKPQPVSLELLEHYLKD